MVARAIREQCDKNSSTSQLSMPKKILLVEDDDSHVYLLRAILEDEKYEVVVASDGKEAVEKAQTEKPDLIFMDIRLPRMAGDEATRQIKANPATKDIPVICLTAASMKGIKEKLLAAGCDSYLEKPTALDAIVQEAKKYLENKSGGKV